jgi:hypothetical protein
MSAQLRAWIGLLVVAHAVVRFVVVCLYSV